MPTIKITEPVRSALLRRPLAPSVTRDRDVPGLALHVTTRRSFWALSYQPRGLNPATNRRWGGGVRHELADAQPEVWPWRPNLLSGRVETHTVTAWPHAPP
jgi:hypothetical protein